MNSFFIEHVKRKGHYTMSANQFHPYYEIYYLLSGERIYFIKDRTYSIRQGDLVFIGKYELHRTADTGVADHERILIQFDDYFLNNFTDPLLFAPFHHSSKRLHLTEQEQASLEEHLRSMLSEYSEQPSGWSSVLQASLAQLLIRHERLLQRESEASFQHASPIHQKISEMVEFINTHFHEQLTLPRLANQFFISPYYLSRKFKEVTGFSFIEYINSVRIKEAQTLLRQTEEPMMAIAERIGFQQIAHFNRVFKQLMNQSPRDYRKSVRSNENFPHE